MSEHGLSLGHVPTKAGSSVMSLVDLMLSRFVGNHTKSIRSTTEVRNLETAQAQFTWRQGILVELSVRNLEPHFNAG